jgi:hypothetical protein
MDLIRLQYEAMQIPALVRGTASFWICAKQQAPTGERRYATQGLDDRETAIYLEPLPRSISYLGN